MWFYMDVDQCFLLEGDGIEQKDQLKSMKNFLAAFVCCRLTLDSHLCSRSVEMQQKASV